jgi:threonine synthase
LINLIINQSEIYNKFYLFRFSIDLEISHIVHMSALHLAPSSFQRSASLTGLQCLRCQAHYPLSLKHEGCPACKVNGMFVSLCAAYLPAQSSDVSALKVEMPYAQSFSLGEGSTPCLERTDLAAQSAVAALWVKDESRNPTGSHKDRMSAIGVTQALEMGAHTLVLASSGNAAISAARYAQAAGLRCEVATYAGLPDAYAQLLREYGAEQHAFEDNAGRWAFVRERSAQPGYLALTNYHLPALGSAPLAVEGYKAIAQECFDEGIMPTDVMVPTARGDLAWGIYAGFSELLDAGLLSTLPRIWIVEPFARLSKVLEGASLHTSFTGQTAQFSTAGATATYLQYQAATASGGGAVVVDDVAAAGARHQLIRNGISAELCAAAAYAAIDALVERKTLTSHSRVLWILTANASRDPSALIAYPHSV